MRAIIDYSEITGRYETMLGVFRGELFNGLGKTATRFVIESVVKFSMVAKRLQYFHGPA